MTKSNILSKDWLENMRYTYLPTYYNSAIPTYFTIPDKGPHKDNPLANLPINCQTIIKIKKIKKREKSKFFTICDTKNSPKISCSLQCQPLVNLKCCGHLNTKKKEREN